MKHPCSTITTAALLLCAVALIQCTDSLGGLGRVSLARVDGGRVFRPDKAGFSAILLLVDDASVECQQPPRPPMEATCQTSVSLAEGFELLVSGGTKLAARTGSGLSKVATALVHFNSLGGIWSEASLRNLEAGGEVICELRIRAELGGPPLKRKVRLLAFEALNMTAEMLGLCLRPGVGPKVVNLAAVYNFRSEWRADNLVDSGRYRVAVRGGAKFTPDGAVLPGYSWLDIDTEGGALTEHMRYGSQWSVFFMFKRSPGASRNSRASLFSLHRAGNPRACSALAWTTEPSQASVYSRVHNLADGYALGRSTEPELDARPGAWNRVGVSFDGANQSVTINGTEAGIRAVHRFPSYASSAQDGLRGALSVGLVKGPEYAMLGVFRCFGVARGFLRPEEYRGLFEMYCQ